MQYLDSWQSVFSASFVILFFTWWPIRWQAKKASYVCGKDSCKVRLLRFWEDSLNQQLQSTKKNKQIESLNLQLLLTKKNKQIESLNLQLLLIKKNKQIEWLFGSREYQIKKKWENKRQLP